MREQDQAAISDFFDSPAQRPLLGLVYGRRRIGKSTMLVREVEQRGGFYFEAIKVSTPTQLERLGDAMGRYLGVRRLAFANWEEALRSIIDIGRDRPIPAVLDEFGYIMEADPSIESAIATALGPGAQHDPTSRVRLILCGSAISLMRALTAGQAPLRGRAGLELVMQPDDYRTAWRRLSPGCDLDTAMQVFSVIGGVVGYATDMVNFDLPVSSSDFDRWLTERVLSPAATLHYEATTLLAEDPFLAGRSALIYNSILGAIANGSVTAGSIAKKMSRPVSNIDPAMRRLIQAGFIIRHEDPFRDKRPLYALNDPFLQFHYAVLQPHGSALRGRDPSRLWLSRLKHVFDSQVRGPVFEEVARTWVTRFASDATLPVRDYVGPSYVNVDGRNHQLDVLVTAYDEVPANRRIMAIGEAKAGEKLTIGHLRALERLRASFDLAAVEAKLLLFGPDADEKLSEIAQARSDVEIVDLERLYSGS